MRGELLSGGPGLIHLSSRVDVTPPAALGERADA